MITWTFKTVKMHCRSFPTFFDNDFKLSQATIYSLHSNYTVHLPFALCYPSNQECFMQINLAIQGEYG